MTYSDLVAYFDAIAIPNISFKISRTAGWPGPAASVRAEEFVGGDVRLTCLQWVSLERDGPTPQYMLRHMLHELAEAKLRAFVTQPESS